MTKECYGSSVARTLVPPPHTVPPALEYIERSTTIGTWVAPTLSTSEPNRRPMA